MQIKRKILLLGIMSVISLNTAFAQFEMSGEIRPRTEYRHGFRTLPTSKDKPAFFTSQRTRINLAYKYLHQFSTYISLQDVRVWGDQDQHADEPSIGVYQAWAKVQIARPFGLKIGRQELAYDDSYLLGTLNWRQTGRSHDAAVLQFQDSTFQAHLGTAYNQDKARLFHTVYQGDYYKTLQLLWLKKEWRLLSGAFMLINRGMQNPDTTMSFTQTFGPTVKYKQGRFSADGIFYYQSGKDVTGKVVKAYFWSAKLGYRPSPQWSWLIGADILSGTDSHSANDPNYTENNTFDILYGLRHRYYGHMDYFYLDFTPYAGLQDLMFKTKYQPQKKLNLQLDVHSFSSQAPLIDPENPKAHIRQHLGVETDFYFTRQLYKNVMLTGGYSHMFAGKSMEIVKADSHGALAGSSKNTANWVWLEISLKPIFLSVDAGGAN